MKLPMWESHGFCKKSDLGGQRLIQIKGLPGTLLMHRGRSILSLQAASAVSAKKRTLIQISYSRNCDPGLDRLTNLELFFR